MNPKVKKLWIEALTSGKYRRGEGQLRQKSGKKVLYCVLGVLCELHRLHTEEGQWDADGETYTAGRTSRSGDLPFAVRKWAGVGKSIRLKASDGKKYDIMDLNDSGMSMKFKDIAALIAAQL